MARRAADPEQRAGAARDPAGRVGHAGAGLRRPHPALPGPARLPARLGGAAGAGRAGRAADRRPRPTCSAAGRGARGRDRPLPRRQRGGRPTWSAPWSVSTTPSSAPRSGHQPARRRPAAAHRRGDRPAVRAVPGRPRGTRRRRPEPGRRDDRPHSARQELVDLLDLEYLDVDLFRGRQPDSVRQRVYGGQVAAQALVAGGAHGRRRTSRCTRCTRTSCCPATTRCRSSTTWSGSATAARSPPGG